MTRRTVLWTLVLLGSVTAAHGQTPGNIFQATLGESGQRTVEVSTETLKAILADKSAVVLDTRPFREFAISHIPGAVNVAAKPGVPMSAYVSDVAEIGRLLQGKKETPLVLYCNGPYCGKSKRLAEELLAAGYTNIRRYQLGIPVWRALGGVTEIEPDGLRHVVANDRTTVLIDAREADVFRSGTLANARNIPRSGVMEGKDVGEVKRAKDDGRLPMEDHNTRLIVIGRDVAEARYVAEALSREAFHNVAYFRGSFQEALAATETGKAPLMVAFADLKWTVLPERMGMQIAVLSGDPKAGPYTELRKVAAGTDNPLHSHSSDITNVIISGVWYTGVDAASARNFGPGSVVTMPADWVHVSGCRAGSDCLFYQDGKGKFDFKPATPAGH